MFKIFSKKKKQKNLGKNLKERLLFIQNDCPHCKLIHGVVEEFNVFLPPEKMIRVVNVSTMWQYNIDLEPIVNYIELKGTPTLFLGGEHPIVVEGVTTREYMKGFLKGYLEKMGDL